MQKSYYPRWIYICLLILTFLTLRSTNSFIPVNMNSCKYELSVLYLYITYVIINIQYVCQSISIYLHIYKLLFSRDYIILHVIFSNMLIHISNHQGRQCLGWCWSRFVFFIYQYDVSVNLYISIYFLWHKVDQHMTDNADSWRDMQRPGH